MAKNYISYHHFVLFFIFFTLFSSKLTAQCAGIDNTNELICDVSNPIYQSVNLFSLLGGSPVPGGTWTDDNNLQGLDPSTGMLNAQFILSGGEYHYTYTAPATSGCTDNKAVVTITIGAYVGVGSQATVCNESDFFNLFTAFDSKVMGPHINGKFTTTAGEPVQSTIPIGQYTTKTTLNFIYTVPPVVACSPNPKSTNVQVTIYIAPKIGEPQDLELCGDTDLAAYTNLNLFDQLGAGDKGGTWTGMGLTSPTDHNINLQELFDTNGPGVYSYTYTVLAVPGNSICPNKNATVNITLEKRLDFTGSKIEASKDICESEISTATYSAKITQGANAIPDGTYNISFSVVGPGISASQNVKGNFVNGVFNFPIQSSYFKQVGEYTITVTGIVSTTSKGTCVNIFNPFSTILTIYPLPRLTNATLSAIPVCQNDDAIVQITAPNLLDGNYRISYNINGDNLALGETAEMQSVGGKASFVVPGSLSRRSGLSVITIYSITNITNPSPQCTNTANVAGNLYINPLPNALTVKAAVKDYCLNAPVTVTVSGLETLTNVNISYALSESNISAVQNISKAVTNGKLDFIIPAELLLNAGSTKITLLNLTNTVTNCDVDLINVADDFIINPIPPAPVVADQQFCKVDEAAIANLEPKGAQYKWYNSATATTPLAANYVLKTEDYFVRETSAAGCTSEPAKVSVIIYDTPAPEMTETPDFCGLANPKISDLSSKTNVPTTVAWYDAVDGNLLPSSTLLVHNATYYGYDLNEATRCLSESYREVKVSLQDCEVAQYEFFIPDGFSPNGDGINDSFVIKDIEFLYPNYTLEIYNRYGNGMYKGDNSKPAWDGKNYEKSGIASGIAPNGVYFYVLHFNKDNKPPKQGRLYLNR
ncbi:gliding motility-associated C-terminal domain-containing protein [Flavobacterium sharifuzzamanii]|uniref:gliding motility-associated C-terminal domain-containing protein n=1 Tax=Flavobacterium sharifuzzamanii TaxID=2211133 RepID=UPI000DAEC721|nr:gliding motility-associated C-terminal domain-containing protein [Flavobacterium sharifuzzamanii]KAF2081869.1 gliding motility-associated C-terminal domain-containing protein [Flavobacterium sharifuzzamanii]